MAKKVHPVPITKAKHASATTKQQSAPKTIMSPPKVIKRIQKGIVTDAESTANMTVARDIFLVACLVPFNSFALNSAVNFPAICLGDCSLPMAISSLSHSSKYSL